MTTTRMNLEIRPLLTAKGRETMYGLRERALGPDDGPTNVAIRADEFAATIHLGAILHGRLVGAVTLMPSTLREDSEAGHKSDRGEDSLLLRCICVDPDHQRRGIGTALLREIEALARQDRRTIHGNSPVAVCDFFRRAGWVVSRQILSIGNDFQVQSISWRPSRLRRWLYARSEYRGAITQP